MTKRLTDKQRLAQAFGMLTLMEREVLMRALEGRYPHYLESTRPRVIAALSAAHVQRPAP